MTGLPPKTTQDGPGQRIINMVRARAASIADGIKDDRGESLTPPMSEKESLLTAIDSFNGYVAGNPEHGAGLLNYLRGQSDEMPPGWIETDRVMPSQGTLVAERWRKENPIKAIANDYVVGPVHRFASGVAQLPVDLGIGAWNAMIALQPSVVRKAAKAGLGVDTIDPINLRQHSIAIGRYLTNTNREADGGYEGALKDAGETIRAVDETAPWLPRVVVGVAADIIGTIRGLAGKTVSKFMGAAAEKGSALAVKLGAEAGGTAARYAGTASSFGALMGVSAQNEDRAQAALTGVVMGPVIEKTSEFGRALFDKIIRKSVLNGQESAVFNAMKSWAAKEGKVPVAYESQNAYLNRLSDQWVKSGAPGMPKLSLKKISADVVQSAAESVGLTLLDARFRESAWDAAINGDSAALGDAANRAVGTFFGVLAMRMKVGNIPLFERSQQEPVPMFGDLVGGPEIKPGKYLTNDMVRFGWQQEPSPITRPRDPGADTSAATPPVDFPKEGVKLPDFVPVEGMTMLVKSPDGSLSYSTDGNVARPNEALRTRLNLPEEMPIAELTEKVEVANIFSSMQSNFLPGEKVGASGVYADINSGMMRTIFLGEVLESPIGNGAEWRPASEAFEARKPDDIDPIQQESVDSLRSILNDRPDLSDADRLLLSGYIDVLSRVSAQNDPSIAEALGWFPLISESLRAGDAKFASESIRELGKVLTVLSPQLAEAGMQKPQDVESKETKVGSSLQQQDSPKFRDALESNAPTWLTVMNPGLFDKWASGKVTDEQVVEKLLGRYRDKKGNFDNIGDSMQEQPDGSRELHLPQVDRVIDASSMSHREAVNSAYESALEELRTARETSLSDVGGRGQAQVGSFGLPAKYTRGMRDIFEKSYDFGARDQSASLKKHLPDKAFVRDGREIEAETSRILGKAQKQSREFESGIRKMGDAALRMEKIADFGDDATVSRWKLIAEGRIPAETPAEKKVAKGGTGALLAMWNEARDAGLVRTVTDSTTGKPVVSELTERDFGVFPTSRGRDLDKIQGNDKLRREWHNKVAEINQHIKVPVQAKDHTGPEGSMTVLMENGKPKMRSITGDDVEAQWLKEIGSGSSKDVDKEAALEFYRHYRLPDTWRVYEIQNIDPYESMRSVLTSQPGRIATAKKWGQDIPDDVRQMLLKQHKDKEIELRPETIANLQRPGVTKRVEAAQKSITNTGDERLSQAYRKHVEDWAVRLQGRNIDTKSRLAEAFTPIKTIFDSALTSVSFVLDIPAVATQGWNYVSLQDMLRGLSKGVTHPLSLTNRAEDMGVLARNMGSHDLVESTGWVRKVSNAFAWAGAKTERWKAGVMNEYAGAMLQRLSKDGTGTKDDAGLMRILEIEPDAAQTLLSGKADAKLEQDFRVRFVAMTTGRGRLSQGSRWAAHPEAHNWVSFGKWITKRMSEIGKVHADLFNAPEGEKASAVRRVIRMHTGFALGGVIGQMLGYVVKDAFKGEDGIERWLEEMQMAPRAMIASAYFGQIIGGPVAAIGQTFVNPTEVKSWSGLTAPGTILYGVLAAIHAGFNGDGWSATKILGTQTGLLPKPATDLVKTVASYVAGADRDNPHDAETVARYERLHQIKRPFGERKNAPEFYSALDTIRKSIVAGNDVKETISATSDAISKALSVAPGQSVAQSIRAMQHLDGWSTEDRLRLLESVDEEQGSRILRHDQAVRELASVVGRMHGESPLPLETEIENVKKISEMGPTDQWRKLVDRVVDESAVALMGDQPMGDGLQTLAEALGEHPEQMANVFDDGDARKLTRATLDVARRTRMIAAMLRSRAKNTAKVRASMERNEQRKERAAEARASR